MEVVFKRSEGYGRGLSNAPAMAPANTIGPSDCENQALLEQEGRSTSGSCRGSSALVP